MAEVRTRLTMEDEATPVLHDFEGRLAGLGRTVGGVTGRLGGFLNVGRILGTGLMRLEISTMALGNAQDRLALSQERLNEVVAKYGPASAEARRAQKELEISTRSLEIAQNRMMIREVFLWMNIIPDVIGTVGGLRGARGLGGLFRGGGRGLGPKIGVGEAGWGGIRGAAGALGVLAGVGGMAALGVAEAQGLKVYGDVNINVEQFRAGMQMSQQLRVDREH